MNPIEPEIEPDPVDPNLAESKRGVVTAVKQQSKRSDRVSIFLDGEFAIGVTKSILLATGIRKGVVVDPNRLATLVKDDEVVRARTKALSYLSYRARTVREIRDRLAKKEFSESVVEEVVVWLSERDYVDDLKFVEQFIEERTSRKGYGPKRIAADLARRGIDQELIENALQEKSDRFAGAVAPIVIKKASVRWTQLRREQDPQKRKSKLVQYLLRRGFSYYVALGIFEQVASIDDL